MAKIKLTKSAVNAAKPQAQPMELRDTLVPGFLCKVTPTGRKVFMLQYRTNAGERRKPALGLYGKLTVEQARSLAQNWLSEVRRGGDPAAAKARACKAPTVKELCTKFMEDYSNQQPRRTLAASCWPDFRQMSPHWRRSAITCHHTSRCLNGWARSRHNMSAS